MNQQNVVYEFKYCDLCDANYIGYTCRHLHQRVEEHKHSVIGKHFLEKHNLKRMNLSTNFKVLKKCRGKLECLIFEMLIIRNILRPTVYTQADSIRGKRFIYAVAIWPVTGQGVENTKWPAVLYSQQISQNRKILANLNYHMSI